MKNNDEEKGYAMGMKKKGYAMGGMKKRATQRWWKLEDGQGQRWKDGSVLYC